jgi:hypothetical protein
MSIQGLNQIASLISDYSCVVYVGAAAVAFVATWAARLRVLMGEHRYRVLAIPIAATVLVAGIGVIDILVRLGKIGVSQLVTSSSATPAPVAAIPSPVAATSSALATAAPTERNESLAVFENENVKLRAENARLRKARTPHVAAALPMPSPCASIAPILTLSKIGADDCDALTGAQRLLDSATRDRIEASKAASTAENLVRLYEAQTTESQAASNLTSLQARLCTTSTGH